MGSDPAGGEAAQKGNKKRTVSRDVGIYAVSQCGIQTGTPRARVIQFIYVHRDTG